MILRRLYSFVLALMLFAAGGAASAGTVYTFGGAAAVSNCTLSGAVYTCPSLPLTGGDDAMVIVSGYTVKITADTTFGYNHSLTMSGSAVLSSTGDLNIGGIATNNLRVTGGTLIAGDVFSVGAQDQTLTADIQAVTAKLGTGSDLSITGSIKATGTVTVASHATINGPISGATVTTNSPVTLVGDIVATNSFTLASGSTVKGNVTAPVVRLLPSNASVQGNITAKTSLQLGSSDAVTGDVTAGTLTLDSSEAIVNGNATIDSGVFNWHGRVTKTIYCTGGTATGRCDCVSNSSGYDVNTASGPHCQGTVVPLDHFLIKYDQAGSLCEPTKVTITACANQACTSTYGGGGSVNFTPGNVALALPPSGIAQTTVNWTQTGTYTLGASGTTANATTCMLNGASAPGADCKVTVSSAAYTMTMDAKAYYAEASTPALLTMAAVRYDAASKTCVPLFNNVERSINFTCAYSNPTGGTLPVRLNGTPLNGGQNASAACDGTGATLKLQFDQDGKATAPVKMQYADVGEVAVKATDSGAGSPPTATVKTTFVPRAFAIALPNTNAPYVAGKDFTVTVTALNAAATPAVTPNFGLEQVPERATLKVTRCQPNNANGQLTPPASTVSKGVLTLTTRWSETGRIDLAASVVTPVNTTNNTGGYLNSGMEPTTAKTNLANPGCTGAVGTFSPAYFTFDTDTAWTRTSASSGGLLQYYSGEPAIKLTVTAHEAGNGITQNYAGSDARDVLFTALNPGGTPLVTVKPDGTTVAVGTFSRSPTYPASDLTGKAQLRGADFTAGVATWTGSYTFTTSPTAPTRVRVRATEDLPTAQNPASSSAIPTQVTTGTEPTLLIRSGRLRMPSRFGPAGTALKVPVSIEYYTGQTWMLNTEDSTTALPAKSVSTGAVSGYTITPTMSPAFTNGKAELTLTPSIAAHVSAPFALNLGTTTANTSCYVARKVPMTDSTAGALPFLRSVDASCAAAGAVDPSALATFGVYAPETKRIIHTREVFR